jgi:S-adenosylmethionine:tRNA ribosyltransferase-isomerase
MKTIDFNYNLPQELIAQHPAEPRDSSRLMIIDRKTGAFTHRHFYDLPEYLKEGDVLVFNDSRVIPARLFGVKTASGGKVEILLLKRVSEGNWEALLKPGKRVKDGATIEISKDGNVDGYSGKTVLATVTGTGENGVRTVIFSDEKILPELGKIPLPPYIHAPLARPERYQTVYAKDAGSVAAPTAGLHMTPELLAKIRAKGVKTLFVTLHVGLDTFRPVTEDDPATHTIHSEFGILTPEVATELSRAKIEGRRVICVGTTSVRMVEQAAVVSKNAPVEPFADWVTLYILPGFKFRVLGAMVTNFHLPKSTLLMMVSAFAGKELIDRAYAEAIRERYRFYSFGDATLIL